MKYRVVIVSILLFISFGVFTKTYAQDSEGRLDLTVSPPVIELTAKPGDQIRERFRVRNNLDTSINLQLSVRRLTSDPTDGNPIPEQEATAEELKWVTFDKPEFTARPSEWEDVTFTIDVPESAAYGYYYVFKITPKENIKLLLENPVLNYEKLTTDTNPISEDIALKYKQPRDLNNLNRIYNKYLQLK